MFTLSVSTSLSLPLSLSSCKHRQTAHKRLVSPLVLIGESSGVCTGGRGGVDGFPFVVVCSVYSPAAAAGAGWDCVDAAFCLRHITQRQTINPAASSHHT